MKLAVPGFEILRLLGRGGMGEVYLARRVRDGQHAALKVASKFIGEQGVARLKREAELLSRISSPHLPKFFGLQELEGRYILGMEFVAGAPLDPEKSYDLDVEARLALLQRVLPGLGAGLRALHDAGIVHRDVKPANCLDAGERGGVVVDLGLATGPQVQTLTATGVAVGTPDFLPPEQVSGEAVSASSDVYQLAMVAQALLLGSVRRPGENPIEAAVRRSVRLPESLRVEAPWIPRGLDSWIQAALHPDPAGRPGAKAHLEALPGVCAQLTPEAGVASEAPSWFAATGAAEVAKVRSQARDKGWSVEATAEASIWRDLAKWEAEAVAMAAPLVGAKEESLAPLPSREEGAPPHPGGISRGLVAGLAALGLGMGVLLGGWLPKPSAPPASKVSFELLKDRIALLGAGTESEITVLHSSGFSRASDGRLSLPLPAKGTLTLPFKPEPVELLFPRVTKLEVEAINDLYWLSATTAHPFPRRAELTTEDVRVTRDRSEKLHFPLGQRLLRSDRATLRFEVAPEIWAEKTISFSEIAKSMTKEVRVPVPELLPNGRIDLTRPGGSEFPHKKIRALMSLDTFDEGDRQSIYDRLIPYALAEFSSRNIPHSHGSFARMALGAQLSILDGISNATSAIGPLNLNITILPMNLALGPNPDRKRLLGSLPLPPPELGSFDKEGFFRTAIKSIPTDGLRLVELWVQAEDTGEGCALEVRLGSHRVLIPLEGRLIQAGTGVPPAWLRSATRNGSDFEFGFKIVPQPGFTPPSNVLVKYVQLRVLREDGEAQR